MNLFFLIIKHIYTLTHFKDKKSRINNMAVSPPPPPHEATTT